MWVSILQNERKKDSDNHINQMKQLIKLSDKPTVSAHLVKLQPLHLLMFKTRIKMASSIFIHYSANRTNSMEHLDSRTKTE